MNNQMRNDTNPGLAAVSNNSNNDISNNNNVMQGQVRQGINNSTNVNGGNAAPIRNGGRPTSGVSTTLTKKKMPVKAEKNPKYTENWINVKAIRNGMIFNDTNEMVTGVKINPKNIFILDQSEMDNTLIGLMNFYNTIDYEFWIMVADRPVDIAMYQAELQLLYNKTADQRIRKIIQQDMDKGDFFGLNNVVDTEYYLLFKEKRLDVIQKRIRDLINGLASAGLVVSQTNNDDLRMIIDNFLYAGRKLESGTVMPQ